MKNIQIGQPLGRPQPGLYDTPLRLKLLCPCAFWVGQVLQAAPTFDLDTGPSKPLESITAELPETATFTQRESVIAPPPTPINVQRAQLSTQPNPMNDTLIQLSVPIFPKAGAGDGAIWTDSLSGNFKAFIPLTQTSTQQVFAQVGLRYTQSDRMGGGHLGAGQRFPQQGFDIGYHAFFDVLFNGSMRGNVGGSVIRDYLQGAINFYLGFNTVNRQQLPLGAASGGTAHITGYLPPLPIVSGSLKLGWYPSTQVRFPRNDTSYACDSPIPLEVSLRVAPVPIIKIFGGIQWNLKALSDHWEPSLGIRLQYRLSKSFKSQVSFQKNPMLGKRTALRTDFIPREDILLRNKTDEQSLKTTVTLSNTRPRVDETVTVALSLRDSEGKAYTKTCGVAILGNDVELAAGDQSTQRTFSTIARNHIFSPDKDGKLTLSVAAKAIGATEFRLIPTSEPANTIASTEIPVIAFGNDDIDNMKLTIITPTSKENFIEASVVLKAIDQAQTSVLKERAIVLTSETFGEYSMVPPAPTTNAADGTAVVKLYKKTAGPGKCFLSLGVDDPNKVTVEQTWTVAAPQETVLQILSQYDIPGKPAGSATQEPEMSLWGLGYGLKVISSETIATSSLNWSSSDGETATIDTNGVFTRLSGKPVTFTVSHAGSSATVTLPEISKFFMVNQSLTNFDDALLVSPFDKWATEDDFKTLCEQYGDLTQYTALKNYEDTFFWVRGKDQSVGDEKQTSIKLSGQLIKNNLKTSALRLIYQV